jgi:WD repeat-containing protein 23
MRAVGGSVRNVAGRLRRNNGDGAEEGVGGAGADDDVVDARDPEEEVAGEDTQVDEVEDEDDDDEEEGEGGEGDGDDDVVDAQDAEEEEGVAIVWPNIIVHHLNEDDDDDEEEKEEEEDDDEDDEDEDEDDDDDDEEEDDSEEEDLDSEEEEDEDGRPVGTALGLYDPLNGAGRVWRGTVRAITDPEDGARVLQVRLASEPFSAKPLYEFRRAQQPKPIVEHNLVGELRRKSTAPVSPLAARPTAGAGVGAGAGASAPAAAGVGVGAAVAGAAAAAAAAEAPLTSSTPSSRSPPPPSPPPWRTQSSPNDISQLLRRRERGLLRGGRAGTSASTSSAQAERVELASRFLPVYNPTLLDTMNSRAYVGQFSRAGDLFVCGFQERRIRVYEVEHDWRLRKEVHCRNLRWTITDTAISPDQTLLAYASITPLVHLVNLNGGGGGGVSSVANVTDIHEMLHVGEGLDGVDDVFGIWSARFSRDGQEIVVGTSDSCLYVHNVERNRTLLRAEGHENDVNAVAWADDASQVLFSGSDDCTCKVWDRRIMASGDGGGGPVGVLIGHTEGITHIDSKADGRYFISNCKDQTVKLWDVRRMSDASAAAAKSKERPLPVWNWDYRYMRFPGKGWDMKHPDDASLQTYTGHLVDQTLIRAYFSPAATTGQRYIYSGSSDGVVAFWDVVSGQRVGDDERLPDGDGGGDGGDGEGGVNKRRRGGRGRGGDSDSDEGVSGGGGGDEGGGGGGGEGAANAAAGGGGGQRGYARTPAVGLCTLNQVDPCPKTYSLSNP